MPMQIHNHKQQEGEIEATGHGTLVMRLPKHATSVDVKFVGPLPQITPCNPIQLDLLEWEILDRMQERHRSHRDLEIKWVIYGSPRMIAWTINF
jgi:hypothetical protein